MKRFHATCLCGPGCQLAMGQATPAKVGWSRQKWLGVSKPSQRSLVRTLQQMWAAGPVREAARHRLPPPHYVVQPAVTRTTTRMQRPLQSFQAAPENSQCSRAPWAASCMHHGLQSQCTVCVLLPRQVAPGCFMLWCAEFLLSGLWAGEAGVGQPAGEGEGQGGHLQRGREAGSQG